MRQASQSSTTSRTLPLELRDEFDAIKDASFVRSYISGEAEQPAPVHRKMGTDNLGS
jgi:hypothetical protein